MYISWFCGERVKCVAMELENGKCISHIWSHKLFFSRNSLHRYISKQAHEHQQTHIHTHIHTIHSAQFGLWIRANNDGRQPSSVAVDNIINLFLKRIRWILRVQNEFYIKMANNIQLFFQGGFLCFVERFQLKFYNLFNNCISNLV